MPEIDVYEQCGLCEIGENLFINMQNFIAKLGIALKPDFLIIYGSTLSLLLTYKAVHYVIKGNVGDNLLTHLLKYMLGGICFTYLDSLMIESYSFLITIMSGIGITIMSIGGVSIDGSGMGALFQAMNANYGESFTLIRKITNDIGWLDVGAWMLIYTIYIPLIASYIIFFCQIIIAVFTLMICVMCMPFVICLSIFKMWEQTIASLIKTAFGSILIVFVSSAIFAFMSLVLKSYEHVATDIHASISILSPKFIFLLVVPSVFCALLLHGVSIANSIFQTQLSNLSTAAMAAGIAAPYAVGFKGVKGLAKTAGAAGTTASADLAQQYLAML